MYFDLNIAHEEPDFTCGEPLKCCKHTTAYKKDVVKQPVKKPEGASKRKRAKKISVDSAPPTPLMDAPLCDPDWFLAAYSPAYVGNFRVLEWNDDDTKNHDAWNRQVSDYFASKGLMTRMIYFHKSDEDFQAYQRCTMLVDMLVYFTSADDAMKAVKTCSGESYYGYKLIVMPGRQRQCYPEGRSVAFIDLQGTDQVTDTENRIELAMSRRGKIKFICRTNHTSVIVQFDKQWCMVEAVSKQTQWKPVYVPKGTPKQRYVEDDVKEGLLAAKESTKGESFMDIKLKAEVLERFLAGTAPSVDTSWMGHTTPLVSPELEKHLQNQNQQTTTTEDQPKPDTFKAINYFRTVFGHPQLISPQDRRPLQLSRKERKRLMNRKLPKKPTSISGAQSAI